MEQGWIGALWMSRRRCLGEPHVNRRHRGSRGPGSLGDVLALLGVSAVYWLEIHPQARRELAAWEHHATRIPDPTLREWALRKLSAERLNPEAAALFAVLAPRAQRRRVVSLLVAYQVMYDYLDAVNEDAAGAELRNGLQLHRALTEAVSPELPVSDYYRRHPRREDGGYMRSLAEACRRTASELPALGQYRQVLTHATQRCGAAQSHNHAVLVGGEAGLIRWSLAQAPDRGDYLWWELAAGGISCLAIHALLACAADPESTPNEAAELDAAYFPAVCAISALLDSLADYHGDARTANHSFVAHYRDKAQVAERLIAIASEASDRISVLPRRRRHAIILAAVCAYYLSSRAVAEGFPALAAERLIDHAGPAGIAIRAMVRARRCVHAASGSTGEPATRRATGTRLLPLLLQRQSRRRTRRNHARQEQNDECGPEYEPDRLKCLCDRRRKRGRKSGDEPQVPVDQRVTVQPGAGSDQSAGSQH
jgi:tetraprenyl-beta-curcumene synthase